MPSTTFLMDASVLGSLLMNSGAEGFPKSLASALREPMVSSACDSQHQCAMKNVPQEGGANSTYAKKALPTVVMSGAQGTQNGKEMGKGGDLPNARPLDKVKCTPNLQKIGRTSRWRSAEREIR
jgi:hypothetical protein